jgi:uncharacterized protein
MSISASGSVDPYKLAKREQGLQGKLAIASMLRASKLLAADEGEISYDLAFAMDTDNLCVITGKLQGEVTFCCQRCLQTYTQAIDDEFVVSPVANDSEAKLLPSMYEPVVIQDGALYVVDLVEDELILALPIVAMHDAAICKPTNSNMQDTEQNLNPFQVLQEFKLKKNGHKAED